MNSPVNVPPFILTYWRPWKEESNLTDSFLDYARDTSMSKYTSESIGKFIESSSKDNIYAIQEIGRKIGIGVDYLGDSIKKSSEQQIEEIGKMRRVLSGKLSEISNELFLVNLRLDQILDQIQASNYLLKDITKLLRVSDSEKERQRSIELGLKFFVSAKHDEDLYEDSLNEFHKAESLMIQDYFTNYYLGLIYLTSPNHLNIEKSNSYFIKSGKYSSLELNHNSVLLENILDNNTLDEVKNISSDKSLIKNITSSSFQKTAFTYYILGDFENALKFQKKSIGIDQSPKNYFYLSKYQSRNNLKEESIQSVNKCLELDPKFILTIMSDLDLISNSDIINIVEKKYIEINSNISNLKQNLLELNDERTHTLISLLENSTDLRIDERINNYHICSEKLNQIQNLILKEENEKSKIYIEQERIKKQKEFFDFQKSEKLVVCQKIIFKSIFWEKINTEIETILKSIDEIIKDDAFSGFFSTSEKLDSKKRSNQTFNVLISSSRNKFSNSNNKEISSILENEFLNFSSINSNITKMNESFNLVNYINMFSDMKKLNDSIQYNFQKDVDFKLKKLYFQFSSLVNIKESIRLFMTDIEFQNSFKEETIEKSHYSSTENKYFIKYINMYLNIFSERCS